MLHFLSLSWSICLILLTIICVIMLLSCFISTFGGHSLFQQLKDTRISCYSRWPHSCHSCPETPSRTQLSRRNISLFWMCTDLWCFKHIYILRIGVIVCSQQFFFNQQSSFSITSCLSFSFWVFVMFIAETMVPNKVRFSHLNFGCVSFNSNFLAPSMGNPDFSCSNHQTPNWRRCWLSLTRSWYYSQKGKLHILIFSKLERSPCKRVKFCFRSSAKDIFRKAFGKNKIVSPQNHRETLYCSQNRKQSKLWNTSLTHVCLPKNF